MNVEVFFFVPKKHRLRQLEDAVHEQPLLTGLGIRERLLELRNERLPLLLSRESPHLLHRGVEIDVVFRLRDHEHPRPSEVYLHFSQSNLTDSSRDLGPDVFVLVPVLVLFDQFGIIFEIEREAVPFHIIHLHEC